MIHVLSSKTRVRMMESYEPEGSRQNDDIGLIGLMLGVVGMWDVPLLVRLSCFAICGICLLVSFISQKAWPLLIRLLLSLAAVSLMSFMGWWSTLHNP